MIRIRVRRYGVEIDGHADYAPSGEDVVCAAASMLFYTLAKRMMDINPPGLVVELEGGKSFVSCAPGNERADEALATIRTGLRMLAMQYPDHVTLRER